MRHTQYYKVKGNFILINIMFFFCFFFVFPGGASGIFRLQGAFQRFCRTSSLRAQFYEKTLDMCGLLDDPESPISWKHHKLEKVSITQSEDAVQKVMIAISSFTNPFKIPIKDRLYSLSAGKPVSSEVVQKKLVDKKKQSLSNAWNIQTKMIAFLTQLPDKSFSQWKGTTNVRD